MKGGGNITDISQITGIKLITSYWSNNIKDIINEKDNSMYSFVGDVHGDLHQFLSPLIINNIITLTGEIETINENIMFYIPKYTINNSSNCKVIYLGDIADEWIFSRTIVYMLYHLLKSNKVIYIYGNHDVSIIGRYHLFKERKLNIPDDIPALWETIKKELNCVKELKIYGKKIEYLGNEEQGIDFLYKYLDPLFEYLYKIFSEQLGRLSMAVTVNNTPFIISHSTWQMNAIRQLLQKTQISEDSQRPSDKTESQLEQVINNYNPKSEYVNYLGDIAFRNQKNIDYVKLSNSCNDVFNSKSRLYLSKNGLTYSRNTNNIFVNQITGHSIGSEWRDIGVNVKPSTFYKERLEKLKPEIVNGKIIYYFDFGSSAGYDHDEISRPDYVYVNTSGMYVTNLPGFSFITTKTYDDSKYKDSLLVMKDKTIRSNNKIVWSNVNK